MRSTVFFLVSFLAWHAHWFSCHVTASPTSIILNSTLPVGINTTSFVPQVQTALFSSDTYRAFYITFDQMIEVLLPPGGDMQYINSLNITDDSDDSQLITHAVQVPPNTTYNPNVPSTSTLVMCITQSTHITLIQYSVTTPPFPESSPQPSTIQVLASVNLPNYVQGVDSFLVVDGVLYLSYVFHLPIFHPCLYSILANSILSCDTTTLT